MASGTLPPNAADLLGGARLYSLISLGSEVFDLIVFDAPPVLGLADAQLISGAAGATVFVVGAAAQKKEMLRSALRRLRFARAKLIGTVLTKFDPKTVGYAYAYSYKYGYEYSSPVAAYGNTSTAQVAGGCARSAPTRRCSTSTMEKTYCSNTT